jgi:hypothetical protein
MMLVILAWAIQEKAQKKWAVGLFGAILYSLISATSVYVTILTYLIIITITRFIINKLWRMPIFIMILMSIIGTFLEHFLSLFSLQFSGTYLPIQESISLVTLPSVLLNLIISIPVYAIITDITRLAYPDEEEA